MKKLQGIVSDSPMKAELIVPEQKIYSVKKDIPVIGMSNAIYMPIRQLTPVKRKGKYRAVTMAVILFFILIGSLLLFSFISRIGLEEGKDYRMVQHEVANGETLWAIIKESNDNNDYDIRNYVYITEEDKRNAEAFVETIHGKILKAGATIYVPQSIEVK
jgi:hypothetical protein